MELLSSMLMEIGLDQRFLVLDLQPVVQQPGVQQREEVQPAVQVAEQILLSIGRIF